MSICPACPSAHSPSFKMPYRAHLHPKSLAQTPWSQDPHHSLCRPLPSMPQNHIVTWWLWTRKIFTRSRENELGHPIMSAVRNEKLVYSLPKFNLLPLPKRTLSLKSRNVRLRLRQPPKARPNEMGKPQLLRRNFLPSEPYPGGFLRCLG